LRAPFADHRERQALVPLALDLSSQARHLLGMVRHSPSASETPVQKDKFNTVAHVNNSTFVGGERAEELPIVVHSHLRWDFVWQRPQQILARLAPGRRI